jgi:hypothetical protein
VVPALALEPEEQLLPAEVAAVVVAAPGRQAMHRRRQRHATLLATWAAAPELALGQGRAWWDHRNDCAVGPAEDWPVAPELGALVAGVEVEVGRDGYLPSDRTGLVEAAAARLADAESPQAAGPNRCWRRTPADDVEWAQGAQQQ